MRTAVLGMGQMGRALAGRLLAQGHEVTVWNRTPGHAIDLRRRGAKEVPWASDAAAGAEVVMSSLADDDAVIEVLVPGGERLPLAEGAAVVDCSTVSPATSRSLALAYPGAFVASPVAGRPAAFEAGEAVLFVGGPPALVRRLDPLLRSVSSRVRLCGDDPGVASIVKLVNNYLLMGGLAVLSEAVAAGQRAGLSDELLTDVLSESALVAPGLRNRLDDLIAGDHDGWFPTGMGAKDVHLFLELAAGHSTVLPIGQLVESRYNEAATSGLADRDITAVIELLRRSR